MNSVRRVVLALIIGILVLVTGLRAQIVVPTTTLVGTVLDDSTGVPLFLANVFVAGTLIGTSTDTLGNFELKGVSLGNADIVASLIGYKPHSLSVRVTPSDRPAIEFRLKQSLIQLQPVVVDAGAWRENFARFTKLLFGFSSKAAKCEILNPGVIDFRTREDEGSMSVEFAGPLQIENKSLGYKLVYYLNEFVMHKDYVQFEGLTEFQELKPQDDEQKNEWLNGRNVAWRGSLQHFLQSLVSRRLNQEGFSAYSVSGISLSNVQKVALEPDKVLFWTLTSFEQRLEFQGYIEVKYLEERPDPAFKAFMRLQGASPSYERLLTVQTSWIKMNKPSTVVRIDGVLSDPYAITTYGYWPFERVAEMLPLDYKLLRN